MSELGVNEILARPVVLGEATAQLPLFPLCPCNMYTSWPTVILASLEVVSFLDPQYAPY